MSEEDRRFITTISHMKVTIDSSFVKDKLNKTISTYVDLEPEHRRLIVAVFEKHQLSKPSDCIGLINNNSLLYVDMFQKKFAPMDIEKISQIYENSKNVFIKDFKTFLALPIVQNAMDEEISLITDHFISAQGLVFIRSYYCDALNDDNLNSMKEADEVILTYIKLSQNTRDLLDCILLSTNDLKYFINSSCHSNYSYFSNNNSLNSFSNQCNGVKELFTFCSKLATAINDYKDKGFIKPDNIYKVMLTAYEDYKSSALPATEILHHNYYIREQIGQRIGDVLLSDKENGLFGQILQDCSDHALFADLLVWQLKLYLDRFYDWKLGPLGGKTIKLHGVIDRKVPTLVAQIYAETEKVNSNIESKIECIMKIKKMVIEHTKDNKISFLMFGKRSEFTKNFYDILKTIPDLTLEDKQSLNPNKHA